MTLQFVKEKKTRLVDCDGKIGNLSIKVKREVWNGNPEDDLANKTRQYVCFFQCGEDVFTITAHYQSSLLRKLGKLLVAYTEKEVS